MKIRKENQGGVLPVIAFLILNVVFLSGGVSSVWAGPISPIASPNLQPAKPYLQSAGLQASSLPPAVSTSVTDFHEAKLTFANAKGMTAEVKMIRIYYDRNLQRKEEAVTLPANLSKININSNSQSAVFGFLTDGHQYRYEIKFTQNGQSKATKTGSFSTKEIILGLAVTPTQTSVTIPVSIQKLYPLKEKMELTLKMSKVNANGSLTPVGTPQVKKGVTAANASAFQVTGLDSRTRYFFELTAKYEGTTDFAKKTKIREMIGYFKTDLFVSIISPMNENKVSKKITISGKVKDAEKVQLFVDGGDKPVAELALVAGSTKYVFKDFDTTTLKNGSHRFTVVALGAKDSKESGKATVALLVDNSSSTGGNPSGGNPTGGNPAGGNPSGGNSNPTAQGSYRIDKSNVAFDSGGRPTGGFLILDNLDSQNRGIEAKIGYKSDGSLFYLNIDRSNGNLVTDRADIVFNNVTFDRSGRIVSGYLISWVLNTEGTLKSQSRFDFKDGQPTPNTAEIKEILDLVAAAAAVRK